MNDTMQKLILDCACDATNHENGRFAVSEKSLEKMLAFGSFVDSFAARTEIHNIAVAIRTGTRAGIVSIEVDDLVLERGASDPFFSAILGVDTIEFCKSKSGRLLVTATVKEVLVST